MALISLSRQTRPALREAREQLREETVYPQLAASLRSGGTLEVGEDDWQHGFVRIRRDIRLVHAQGTHRDFAAIRKGTNPQANDFRSRSGQPQAAEKT